MASMSRVSSRLCPAFSVCPAPWRSSLPLAAAPSIAQDDAAKFYKGKTVQAIVGYGPGSTFELYLAS